MNLTQDEIGTLKQLGARRAGGVRFVSIAPAQALTGLGLASRTRQGWLITGEGSAWLKANLTALEAEHLSGVVVPFASRANPARLH